MCEQRPYVFIGSSAEGLDEAKAIQANLEFSCESVIWSQGVFGLSEGSLESLVKKLEDFDFAILVLTPDDLTESRGERQPSPRDNVLLELGLFIGALGRDRTYMVCRRAAALKLPSDLAGIEPAAYQPPTSGTLQSALGSACTAIEQSIKGLGSRKGGISISAGAYIDMQKGIKGFSFVVHNKGRTPIPPYRVCVAHPKLGQVCCFPAEQSGELLPDQKREHRCPVFGEGSWGSRPWAGSLANKDSENDTTFQLVLEHSDRVLYENKRIGSNLIRMLRKVFEKDNLEHLSFQDWIGLNSESWRWE